jgi:hypothetical protein
MRYNKARLTGCTASGYGRRRVRHAEHDDVRLGEQLVQRRGPGAQLARPPGQRYRYNPYLSL